MVNYLPVNADHGRDFHPLFNHMTNSRTFNREFSAFPSSLQLMLDHTLKVLNQLNCFASLELIWQKTQPI